VAETSQERLSAYVPASIMGESPMPLERLPVMPPVEVAVREIALLSSANQPHPRCPLGGNRQRRHWLIAAANALELAPALFV